MASASAWNAGWEIGKNAAQHSRDRKEMLSDEDRQQRASDLIATRNGILSKMPTLLGDKGEKTPEYDAAFKALTQTQNDLGQLYHPDKSPGALQKDWYFLLEKMHGIDAPKGKKAAPDAPRVSISTEAQAVPAQTMPGMTGNVGDIQPDMPYGSPPPIVSAALPAETTTTLAPAAVTPASPAKGPSWGEVQKLKQKAASMQVAQGQAEALTAALPLSPGQQAMKDFDNSEEVRKAKIKATLKTFDNLFPNASQEDKDRFKNNLAEGMLGGKSGSTIGQWDRLQGKINGQPASLIFNKKTGEYRYATGENVPADMLQAFVADPSKPTKAVRGTIMNTKSNGWVQTWVDPYNPSKIVGFQKVAPGSRYTGTTGGSSSTDPYGVTTTTSRSTTPNSGSSPVDVDLSGAKSLPETYNGEELSEAPTAAGRQAPPIASGGSPNKSPVATPHAPATVAKPVTGGPAPQGTSRTSKALKTPSELKAGVPSPPAAGSGQFQVDSSGHIPESDIANRGINSSLAQLANNILDGEDITKVNTKDRGAAEALAKKYGWQGQGLFTPKEKLLLKESATYLDKAIKSSAMKALDNKASRARMANAIHAADDKSGMISKMALVEFGLSPQESDFVSTYLQLIGTISGLGQLTRGGRMTEATAKRLMNELPNPLLTQNSQDGIDKLMRLRSEIDVATQKGAFDLSSDSQKTGSMSLDEFKKKHKI